jgi:hypothetical protein
MCPHPPTARQKDGLQWKNQAHLQFQGAAAQCEVLIGVMIEDFP